MGKKPVFGLVGLCLSLALTGCKDCNCGWGAHASRKDDKIPVARRDRATKVKNTETADATDSQERQRSIPNTAPVATGNTARPNPYEFPNSWDVPAAKPVADSSKSIVYGPKSTHQSVTPLSPPPGSDLVPAGRLDLLPDVKPAAHETTGSKPIVKPEDKAAAGLPDSPDMLEVPGESAKKTTPAKEVNSVATPIATPKAPGELPVVVEPVVIPKKSVPAVEGPGWTPPGEPVPVKSSKISVDSEKLPPMPIQDIPEAPAIPTGDLKPVAPSPVAKPEVVTETKTVVPPPVTESVPPAPAPMEVKGGPKVDAPIQPPTPMAPPTPTPGKP